MFVAILLVLCVANAALGQSEQKLAKKAVNQGTLFGVGSMILTDTYLSPLEYNGLSLSLLRKVECYIDV